MADDKMAGHNHDKQLWKDRLYKSRPLSNFPRLVRVSDRLPELMIDYACADDVPACRQMALESAQRADNVGLDEFIEEGEEAVWTIVIETSDVFTVTSCSDRKQFLAFLLISPAIYSRTVDASVADIHVFRSRALYEEGALVYAALVGVATRLATDMDIGYGYCLMNVDASRDRLLRQLGRQGFRTVATFPVCVKMADVGWTDNVVLVKDLGMSERKVRSNAEVELMTNKFFPPMEESENDVVDWPRVDFLPAEFYFRSGIRARLRNVQPQDSKQLFTLYLEAMNNGEGYCLHEIPTLGYFQRVILSHSHCVVVEEVIATSDDRQCTSTTEQHRLMAAVTLGSSWYRRSPEVKYCDASVVVSRDYKRMGIGHKVVEIIHGISKQLGYIAMVNDVFANNSAMFRLLRDVRLLVIGCIPHGGYVSTSGWQDQMITWTDLSTQDIKTFDELLADNSAQRAIQLTKSARL